MKNKKHISILLCVLLVLSVIPFYSVSGFAQSEAQAVLTFSENEITETSAGSGYTVDGTTLTITANGVYEIGGSCSEGAIVVNKSLSDVTLVLNSLELANSSTAPIVIKKSSDVTVELVGTSTLTDNEDASTEETNSDFEGAAIKVKSGSSLTVTGDGALIINGNAKNGIKGAAESSFIMESGSVTVTAENNGIAFDGSVVIYDGTITVDSGNDGIKAVPDEGDTASAGTIDIYGGIFTVIADGDGIQAGTDLTITNGSFNITTLDGYASTSFDKDTMSCKGLKASGDDDDTEEATNTITISGGTFNLDTADDAVHSDAYAVITGGTFYIYTGDDGVHADTSLNLGTENGLERDPEIFIYASYEGLEAGTVYGYSGKYWVVASDDGINAAGGSSDGTDTGSNDHFNPGGGPGGNQGTTDSSDYSINIYGGSYYVNCTGDGLDSNGALNLYGGTLTVFSQASGGDNSPLDSEGTILIDGATVFAAGTNPMNENPSNSSQKYYTSTTSRSANTVINIKYGGSVVYSDKLVRNVNYILYSSPDMTTTSCTVTTGGSVDNCKSHAWAHNWDSGVITTEATETTAGVITYTCQDCGKVEMKTIPATSVAVDDNDEGEEEETTEYTVTFELDSHTSVDIYYTQDYTEVDEEDVTSAVARDSSTGETDISGDGQVNFAITVDEGYVLDSISIDGSYKNLKEISSEEIENLYRITKISSDLTVTVSTALDWLYPDVCGTNWFYSAVKYVSNAGYMKGYSNGYFGPADALQRQDFVVTLARIAGVDLTEYEDAECGLTDVNKGTYYYSAICWAVEQGIITGYENGKFGVGDQITREQIATILYRYLGSPDIEGNSSTILADFSDAGKISAFAENAMLWAVENGIIKGMNDTTLAPLKSASRAEIATIIMRMDTSGMFSD